MRTFAFVKNGRVALYADATDVVHVNIYRFAVINNASMADWAAEAALHHHGVVEHSLGEYPTMFGWFFQTEPTVNYSRLHGGWVYTWETKGVSILLQD